MIGSIGESLPIPIDRTVADRSGWTISAAFGYCLESWCTYQSDLTLIWASLAFLIGSLILWYEALDKYPVKRASKVQ